MIHFKDSHPRLSFSSWSFLLLNVAFFILILEILRTEFIIVTDFSHKRLLQISIQNGSIVKLPINVKSPGMAVDKTAKKLYFTDIEEKTIQVSTLFGENTSTFYATGIYFVSFEIIISSLYVIKVS